jgi:hypothetical protein
MAFLQRNCQKVYQGALVFARKLEKMLYLPEFSNWEVKLIKKILLLLFMIYGMNLTTRADDSVNTAVDFPRETYVCGPSVVLAYGEDDLFIFMSPSYEGCKDIETIWSKDIIDTQIVIQPTAKSKENFVNLRPTVNMMPETYEFLCVDINAYDKREEFKLYGFDYYIYK